MKVMDILGVKFAPLNTPLKRRIETFITGSLYGFSLFGSLVGPTFIIVFTLITGQWLAALLYLLWIWVVDKNVRERGGRRVEFVRGLNCWKSFRNYFPIRLQLDSSFELDPKQNYLFCSFPHGVLATGCVIAFGTKAGGFHKLFPNHKAHLLTLQQNFLLPIYRDILLSLGSCSASANSINWLMRSPDGGNVGVLVVGGAAESFYSRPGQYHLVLKKRKGFVKLAIKNGSPLVPVFSFGETDIFDQVNNPEGSLLRCAQEFIKRKTGIAPIIPLGRGYLQYSYGFVPRRKPINVIVGKPLDITKIENPTQEDIDIVHEAFINRLMDLFERHKHKYLNNADDTKLVID